jgi:hypothetical protein
MLCVVVVQEQVLMVIKVAAALAAQVALAFLILFLAHP